MGERLRAVQRAIRTWLGTVTVALLVLAVVIALVSLSLLLRSTQGQLTDLRDEQTCRSAASATLEVELSKRDDTLSDLQESIARLFDASIRRDTEAIASEGRLLPGLTERIHSANEAVRLARDERVASVDACTDP